MVWCGMVCRGLTWCDQRSAYCSVIDADVICDFVDIAYFLQTWTTDVDVATEYFADSTGSSSQVLGAVESAAR